METSSEDGIDTSPTKSKLQMSNWKPVFILLFYLFYIFICKLFFFALLQALKEVISNTKARNQIT